MWSCLTAWGRTRRCSLFEKHPHHQDVRNNVNRAANCDSANLDKTMNAAQKQIEAIRLIEEKGAFSRMPRSLREIAEKAHG